MSSEIEDRKVLIEMAFEIEERRLAISIRRRFSNIALLLAIAAVIVAMSGDPLPASGLGVLSAGLVTAAATGTLPRKRPRK
jgi:hypothetical protein